MTCIAFLVYNNYVSSIIFFTLLGFRECLDCAVCRGNKQNFKNKQIKFHYTVYAYTILHLTTWNVSKNSQFTDSLSRSFGECNLIVLLRDAASPQFAWQKLYS